MSRRSAVLAAICLAGCIGFAVFAPPGFAQESATERIRSFSVRIELETNGVLQIAETIVYDFGSEERHGIFRDIPLEYNGGRESIDISAIRVVDDLGTSQPIVISKKGDYLRIRIGDPEVLISGVKTYTLNYAVDGAVQWGRDADRIIWNATGNEWPVGIDSAEVLLDLPSSAADSAMEIECYQGAYGSTESCNSSGAAFASRRFLAPGEGLTILVLLAKGILTPPSFPEKLWAFISSYIALLLPLITFGFFFAHWWRRGRDPKGRGTIVPQYEPPEDLSPLEAGLLVKGRANLRHVSAEIIHLAVRGYLKISPKHGGLDEEQSGNPKDFTLTKIKEIGDDEAESDRILMEGLFAAGPEVSLSDLRNKFSSEAGKVLNSGYGGLVVKGYYNKDPRVIFALNLLVPLGLLIVLVLFGWGSLHLGVISLVAAALITLVFAAIMPRVTKKGALGKEHIAGFRDYLDIAEKDRLNFHNAPEKTPELFERFLPYALALGVVEAWAKEFREIYTEPPQWYSGSIHGAFVATSIAGDLQSFERIVGKSLASTTSSGSGGGGFSGGGAGGGGGGSW